MSVHSGLSGTLSNSEGYIHTHYLISYSQMLCDVSTAEMYPPSLGKLNGWYFNPYFPDEFRDVSQITKVTQLVTEKTSFKSHQPGTPTYPWTFIHYMFVEDQNKTSEVAFHASFPRVVTAGTETWPSPSLEC